MKKFFVFVLLALAGVAALPQDAEAYWHGRYWGGGRFYHPGWGCGWRCGGPGWHGAGWVGPAVAAGVVGAGVVEGAPYAAPVIINQPGAPVIQYSAVPPIGSIYPTLPTGCVLAPRGEINFYQCAGYRVRPLYGPNGLHYRVVPE